MVTAYPAPTKREAILLAAMAVFAERGYQGATLDEIARRAGVAKGTAYIYFTDKSELFFAVFEKWTGEAMGSSEIALAEAVNTQERLLALALSAVEFMQAHQEWFPLTLEVWSASGSPLLRERFRAALSNLYAGYREEIRAIVEAGQQAGEVRRDVDAAALAAMLTGAVDGLFLQCWFDPALDAEMLVRNFFEVLTRGLSD